MLEVLYQPFSHLIVIYRPIFLMFRFSVSMPHENDNDDTSEDAREGHQVVTDVVPQSSRDVVSDVGGFPACHREIYGGFMMLNDGFS